VTTKNSVFWDVTRVALVRTDVSEETSASFIRVARISKLGTTLAATSNRRTLRSNTLSNFALKHGVLGSGCIDPCPLDFGTRWRRMGNFTLRPLYSAERSHRDPLCTRLDGSQKLSGRYGEEKILFFTKIQTPN
jgi:hypothetical protein